MRELILKNYVQKYGMTACVVTSVLILIITWITSGIIALLTHR